MTAPDSDRASIEAAVEALTMLLKCAPDVFTSADAVHLRIVLAELKRLGRVEQARDDSPRTLRHAFAAGWHSHSAAMNGALATVGFEDREAAAKDWFRVAAADLAARDGRDGEPR